MSSKALAQKALEQGGGVFRLAPAWVPRSFCRPGRRLKLHPDDYYALGMVRGGIDERWFASTTPADNGPGTPEDEGLSYIVLDEAGKERVLLIEAVRELGAAIIGEELWKQYGRWPIFSKFFDNLGPLPHHIHHRDHHAALTGQAGKPEMYFFPSQMNNYPGEFAYTFFGINPGVSKEQVRECLENFKKGDNHLLELSRAYKLRVDTGWDVPPGVLHAPGSLCTYEPQFASDVYAMYQSVLFGDHCVPPDLLWKNTPENRVGDYDLLMEVIDWDLNVDPDFAAHRFMLPKPAGDPAEMEERGYREEWICYKCPLVSAKRLTVYPGREAVIRDTGAYGFILLEGYGACNGWTLEAPAMIRYGQLTNDEFFVTREAAGKGVRIKNCSKSEPLVLLKHFAGNPART
ncbi:MAG: hypothetical protein LBP32_02095 [Spirochaetaceae bacterium]|jgi:hypothetical protein|nr:hypothetical protein [Spirochaetaceae bacterium]